MRRPVLKRLALLAFGLLLGLALAELIARQVYSKPWHMSLIEDQGAGGWKGHPGGKVPYLREQTLRWLEQPVEPRIPTKPDAKRILILGDSFTYGTGVLDPGDTFPALIEKRLNGEAAGVEGPVEVLNCGIPGSLTKDWLDLLGKVLEKDRDWDLVMVVFFMRDGTRLASIDDFFRPIRLEALAKYRSSFIYRHSYLVRLCRDQGDRRELSERYSRAMNEAYLGGPEETAEWENAKQNLLAIREAASGVGAETGLVVFPVLGELTSDYPFKAGYELVVGFGRSSGFPTFGLLPAFLGVDGPELWVAPTDQHPNESAHRIAAEAMTPFVRALLERP